jgi:signal transduction histidine kinase
MNSSHKTIVCDADLLFQALANVVDNAVKYTPEGGKIDLCATVDKNHLYIEIADSGIGVPSAEFDNLFSRFYRVDKSRQLAGNGLGLSLVKAIIKLHNGSITLFDNSPGLKVVISVPLDRETLDIV